MAKPKETIQQAAKRMAEGYRAAAIKKNGAVYGSVAILIAKLERVAASKVAE